MGDREEHERILREIHEVRVDLGKQRKSTSEVRKAISELRRMIVALTQNQQQAVNDLSSAVETLATDLADVTTASEEAKAKLQAYADQDVVDAADKARLQAIIDGFDTDVVGALTPITDRVKGIDAGLKSPETPAEPFHATT